MLDVICYRRTPFDRGISIGVRKQDCDDAPIKIAKDIVWSDDNPNYYSDALLTLHPNQAQVMMDTLWECGIRPTEGMGSAGSFAAQQRHLEDMRKLVFDVLKIKP